MSALLTQLSKLRVRLGLDEKRCVHCLSPFSPNTLTYAPPVVTRLLCEECLEDLAPYAGCFCASCGRPVTPNSLGSDGRPQCQPCREDPPPWNAASFYGIYKDALKDLILRLKFNGELAITRLFADFLFHVCQNLPRPDLTLPIPQYPAQTRARGYNQAHEIAGTFAKKCRLSYDANILIRVKPGDPQEKLNAVRRRQNLKEAFHCERSLSGQSVWLIDDVLTTGSTCREATYALRAADAAEVRVIFIGRADS
ncbi:MAG: ComF family protein [Desulfovibrio sp.]|nr:ComF family protein [Desulfovibrio sp.]